MAELAGIGFGRATLPIVSMSESTSPSFDHDLRRPRHANRRNAAMKASALAGIMNLALCLPAKPSLGQDRGYPRPPDNSGTWGPMTKLVAVDSLNARHGQAVIVRTPGQPDAIFVRTSEMTPSVVSQAIRQLKMLRAVQGEVATAEGMFRVTTERRRPVPGRAEDEAARERQDSEARAAADVGIGLVKGSSNKHGRQGIGEGKSIDLWLRRVIVQSRSP